MVMFQDQNAGRSHNTKIERVEEFKYQGTTLTIQINSRNNLNNSNSFRKKLRAD
jgi:hypothetical protein